MKKWLRTALLVAAAVAIWSVLWGQQPQQEPATVEQRLETAEQRLALLEKALNTSAESPTLLPDAARESRLNRLEGRVDRLEAQSLRQPVGAPSAGFDRMLESRVRMLEQQIARLSR